MEDRINATSVTNTKARNFTEDIFILVHLLPPAGIDWCLNSELEGASLRIGSLFSYHRQECKNRKFISDVRAPNI